MLNSIISILSSKQEKLIIFPQYNQFINNTNKLLNQYIINTYNTSIPLSSKGLNLLETFLSYVNLNDFLAITNLTDQLFYIKQYIVDNIFTTTINNTNKLIITTNAFIKTPIFLPAETIIPIPKGNSIDFYQDCFDSYQQYALSSITTNKQKNNLIFPPLFALSLKKSLLPFRLVYIDSQELSLNIKQGKLFYSTDIPSTISFLIHIEKLFMGLAYYTKIYENTNQEAIIRNYLYQWCILPLLNDAFDIWLINIINSLLSSFRNNINELNVLKEKVYNSSFIEQSTFGYIFQGTNTRWLNDIWSLIQMVSKNNIGIKSFLSNIQLPSGYTLFQYLYYIAIDNELPELIQVHWLNFLKSYNLFKLILQLLDISKKPSRKSIIKELYKIIRQYKNNHIWVYCPDKILKSMIKNEINSFYQWLKNKQ